MQEIWKDIKGYEGLYQVSNLGRVKSLNKYRRKKEIIMKPAKSRLYLQIEVSKNNKQKKMLVHRLVAETFIPNPNNLPQVNHKDENKLNNRTDNLEWCDAKYNINYGNRTKKATLKSIESHKKPVIQYDKNGNYIKTYPSMQEAEIELKIASGGISKCCIGVRKTAGGFLWKTLN